MSGRELEVRLEYPPPAGHRLVRLDEHETTTRRTTFTANGRTAGSALYVLEAGPDGEQRRAVKRRYELACSCGTTVAGETIVAATGALVHHFEYVRRQAGDLEARTIAAAQCNADVAGFLCTRAPGHDGPHVSSNDPALGEVHAAILEAEQLTPSELAAGADEVLGFACGELVAGFPCTKPAGHLGLHGLGGRA